MNLNKILKELESYKNYDKEKVLAKYIQSRLNNSLNSYYKDLDKNLSAITSNNSKRRELKVLKKLNSGLRI